MAVLQAYQANLLKELDVGEEIKSEDISELRRTDDLSLRATKETARAIRRSMAAMVAADPAKADPVRYERKGQSLPYGRPACAIWPVW